jgi:hypothetical protein
MTTMLFKMPIRRGDATKFVVFEAKMPTERIVRDHLAEIGFMTQLEKSIDHVAQQNPALTDDEIIKMAIELVQSIDVDPLLWKPPSNCYDRFADHR